MDIRFIIRINTHFPDISLRRASGIILLNKSYVCNKSSPGLITFFFSSQLQYSLQCQCKNLLDKGYIPYLVYSAL